MVSLRLRVKTLVKEEVSMSAFCYPESPEIFTPEKVYHKLTTGDYSGYYPFEFIDDELAH
jgi:hypothetical protein